MSNVLSALVIVAALTASGVILVQLVRSEGRRGRSHADPPAAAARAVPPQRAVQPERWTAPPAAARAAPAFPVAPVATAPVVPAAPAAHSPLPERTVPPPPAPRVRPAPVRPVQSSWVGTLSPDGAWLWTGSAWVPAWWGGPTVPPPPTYVAVPPPPAARSTGCVTAFGMGCGVVVGFAALILLMVLAATGGLTHLPGA